ncbi:MAG: hypothetical protein ACK5QW_05205 [Cyanobacteriota bacterium]
MDISDGCYFFLSAALSVLMAQSKGLFWFVTTRPAQRSLPVWLGCFFILGCFASSNHLARAVGDIAKPTGPGQSSLWIAAAAGFLKPFDPVATARLRTGEMVEAIKATRRQGPASASPDLIQPALLIQAGLRILLPPDQRQGLALPGEPGPKDSKPLVSAQNTWTAVYQSGRPANRQERAEAHRAILKGSELLETAGYREAARVLRDWIRKTP